MNKQILKLFSAFIEIQSVSADPKHYSEILKAADFLKKEIKSLGFGVGVNVYQKKGSSPLIIAEKFVSTKAKTIAIYAHYDVQAEDPVEKWNSPPFTLKERNGKLFARGVADDKGHIIQTLAALQSLISANQLTNNIILIFEGEEEMESKNFEFIIKSVKSQLSKADVFYVLDSGMKTKNVPQIFYGLRGIITGELSIKTSQSDLHSGVFGNRVYNPVQVIAELLAKIKDGQTNQINIPGFYDQVVKVSQKEIGILSEYVLSEVEEKKNTGVKSFIGGFLTSKILPSFEVNGITSGYNGPGAKTIIPAEANMKFSIRLVPGQTPKKIRKIVKKFILENLPKELDYRLKIDSGCGPFYTDFDNQYAKKTAKFLTEVFKNKTYFNRSGGSVAAAEILQRLFKKPIILTGFTLPDENIHAPNENIDGKMFEKGILALEKIISQ